MNESVKIQIFIEKNAHTTYDPIRVGWHKYQNNYIKNTILLKLLLSLRRKY
jgi:hypothetical protein